MLSTLGSVGRPEAEKGIGNVKQLGDKEEGLSQMARRQLSALIPATPPTPAPALERVLKVHPVG